VPKCLVLPAQFESQLYLTVNYVHLPSQRDMWSIFFVRTCYKFVTHPTTLAVTPSVL